MKSQRTDDETVGALLQGPLAAELSFAVSAVAAASTVCRRVQSALVTEDTVTKKDRSPVTVADFAAQAVVSLILHRAVPEVPIVGEESADALRTADGEEVAAQVARHVGAVLLEDEEGMDRERVLSAIEACSDPGGATGRYWVLDPIDGTKGYLRRGQYAVALALLEEGQPVLGVLGCPALEVGEGAAEPPGCLFAAAEGLGAVLAPLGQSPVDAGASLLFDARGIRTTELQDASLAVLCESVESAHSSHERHAAIARELGVHRPSFRIDSQCKYGAVARGDASIYLRLPTSQSYREKIWDHAAGWMVVTEAGGRVTDITGRDLDFSLGRTLDDNQGVVATNGHLHEDVLAAIRATEPGASQ